MQNNGLYGMPISNTEDFRLNDKNTPNIQNSKTLEGSLHAGCISSRGVQIAHVTAEASGPSDT